MAKEKALPKLNRIQLSRAPKFLDEVEQKSSTPSVVASETPRIQTQWEKTVQEWLFNYKWGQRFANWSESLSNESLDEVSELLRCKAYELFYESAISNPDALESAYISLLDNNQLDRFMDESIRNSERDKLAQELFDKTAAGAAQATAEYEASEEAKALEIIRDMGQTKDGLKAIRRHVIPSLAEDRVAEFKSKIYMG